MFAARASTATFALALLVLTSVRAAAQAAVAYTLTDQPGPAGGAGHWHVVIDVRGLDPAGGPLGLFSDGWGWPQAWPYLDVLESDPPVAEQSPDGSSLTLEVPPKWDGHARVAYRVRLTTRGSDEHRRFELVPSRGDGYAYGNSSNVLLRPNRAGEPFEAAVSVEVVAAEQGGTLVTGWGGRATGTQRSTPELPWGNSPVVFGAPTSTTTARDGAFVVESFQFRGPDATSHATELVLRLAPTIERATGWPARSPSRVFLSSAMSAGMGSEYGLHMNVPSDAGSGFERDPGFETTLAHELFHEWLGIRLHESHGSLVWFREGFTEYFAQWFAASRGITSRAYFAETLEGFDRYARRNTSLGRTAFADPGVNWRDGDGPNELMAYRGAPVLALALDVELRASGHPGLLQLLRDFLAREEHVFPPDDLRAWFVENGLEERWNTSIAGRDVPAAVESLVRAGFESVDVPVDVAYLGLQTVERKPIWEVLAVDTEGPAARAGVKVGDVIEGFFPFNGAPTRLKPVSTPYTFGLAIFTPSIEGSFLEIVRSGESTRLSIEPDLRPWGLRTEWRTTRETDAFFSFAPR